jgi:co-chaperonin GroES (HSP10)
MKKRYNRIRPVNGGIVVDMKFENQFGTEVGGIVLPDTTLDRESKEIVRARILDIDTKFHEGKELPVKVGDVVIIKRHAGLEVEMYNGGATKRVIPLDAICCVLDGYLVPEPELPKVKKGGKK